MAMLIKIFIKKTPSSGSRSSYKLVEAPILSVDDFL
jgi:hypothetical protein